MFESLFLTDWSKDPGILDPAELQQQSQFLFSPHLADGLLTPDIDPDTDMTRILTRILDTDPDTDQYIDQWLTHK